MGKGKDYSPHIRCKKQFSVRSEAHRSKSEPQGCQQYDFQFVTFLRHILSTGQEIQTSSIPCAGWVDQDQGIFRINSRQEFSIRWYAFKGVDCKFWDCLYNSVIKEFINRNLF